jgi:hypothetical protein
MHLHERFSSAILFQLLRNKFLQKMDFLANTESLMAAVINEEIFQRLADIKLGLQVMHSSREY